MVVETETVTRYREALQLAQSLFSRSNDWVSFFRQTLGLNGFVKKMFPDQQDRAEFEQSDEFREIQQMVSQLRKNRRRKKDKNSNREPTKVITVRMPKSLHELLEDQAKSRGTSINSLCISKLLQLIENDQASSS